MYVQGEQTNLACTGRTGRNHVMSPLESKPEANTGLLTQRLLSAYEGASSSRKPQGLGWR